MTQDLWLKINKPKSNGDLDDLEKKHLPMIDCPDKVKAGEPFEVKVHVGKLLPHPNENVHFIGWIELLAQDLSIARADLTPVSASPRLSLEVKLQVSCTLIARAMCNIHGIWQGSRHIEVQ